MLNNDMTCDLKCHGNAVNHDQSHDILQPDLKDVDTVTRSCFFFLSQL